MKVKKPDPSIYITAAKVIIILKYLHLQAAYLILLAALVIWFVFWQKLGVSESNCLVVEDSVIGLQVHLPIFWNSLIFLNSFERLRAVRSSHLVIVKHGQRAVAHENLKPICNSPSLEYLCLLSILVSSS